MLSKTVSVAPPIASQSNIFSPVYFASNHSIKVEIYNSTGSVRYFTDTKSVSTLYPAITPWSWTVSNGEATDTEIANSYASLISEGLVGKLSLEGME